MTDPLRLHRRLLEVYGPQGWWPGGGEFEVFVGALLVQRTSWHNAELAIEALRAANLLAPEQIACAPIRQLAAYIRSCGFHGTKSRRLQGMARWFVAAGGFETLSALTTSELRPALLDLEGVGEETADAILLYAFDRPVVVIDEYLRRLLQRVTGSGHTIPDAQIREIVGRRMVDARELNEFHALVVAHGKQSCRKLPHCEACRLRDLCRAGRGLSDA